MDRKLLAGAILFFFLQAYLLLADVDIFPKEWGLSGNSNSRSKVGQLAEKHLIVKKKGPDSIIWDDSETQDDLYAYDSIITFDKSSARLHLNNNVEIDVQEKTLVIIEPAENQKNEKLRLRFSHGDLKARTGKNSIELESKEWTIEATPESVVNVKALAEGQVELEVSKGQAIISQENDRNNKKSVSQGERATMSDAGQSEIISLSSEIQFDSLAMDRYYSFTVPVQRTIRWQGEARKLRIVLPDKKITYIDLEPHQQQISLPFNWGVHHLSLEKAGQASKELEIDIRESLRTKYTSPLPRDRFAQDQNVEFAWLSEHSEGNYIVTYGTHEELNTQFKKYSEMQRTNLIDPDFFVLKKYFDTNQTNVENRINASGKLYFQVWSRDVDGYLIPPYYQQEFYVVPDPFAPPQLRTPAKEESDKESRLDSNSFWQWIAEIIFPRAMAQSNDNEGYESSTEKKQSKSKSKPRPDIVFHWLNVQGADHYILEISPDADFEVLEVEKKLRTEKFVWTNFRKRVYYWRVAAGSDDGRMGLFSEPSKLDLSLADQFAPGELQSGIEVIWPQVDNRILPVVQQQAPTPDLATNTTSETKSESNIVNSEPIEEKINFTYQKRIQLNIHNYFYDFGGDLDVSYSGISTMSAGFGLDRLRSDGWDWFLKGKISTLDWTPKDKNKTPFQDTQKTTEYRFQAQAKPKSSEFFYGAVIETLPYPKRLALEEIEIETHVLLGPILGIKVDVLNGFSLHLNGGILFNTDEFAVWSGNTSDYYFNDEKSWYCGADLDLVVFFGRESAAGLTNTTGAHIGYEW